MWSPEPLPSSKEVENLKVSLVGFETNRRRPPEAKGMFSSYWQDRVMTRAVFELEQQGCSAAN